MSITWIETEGLAFGKTGNAMAQMLRAANNRAEVIGAPTITSVFSTEYPADGTELDGKAILGIFGPREFIEDMVQHLDGIISGGTNGDWRDSDWTTYTGPGSNSDGGVENEFHDSAKKQNWKWYFDRFQTVIAGLTHFEQDYSSQIIGVRSELEEVTSEPTLQTTIPSTAYSLVGDIPENNSSTTGTPSGSFTRFSSDVVGNAVTGLNEKVLRYDHQVRSAKFEPSTVQGATLQSVVASYGSGGFNRFDAQSIWQSGWDPLSPTPNQFTGKMIVSESAPVAGRNPQSGTVVATSSITLTAAEKTKSNDDWVPEGDLLEISPAPAAVYMFVQVTHAMPTDETGDWVWGGGTPALAKYYHENGESYIPNLSGVFELTTGSHDSSMMDEFQCRGRYTTTPDDAAPS